MKVEQHLSELLAAILPHVVFDGWSQTSFECAVADLTMDAAFADVLAPRGALDLAVAYHRQGDVAMIGHRQIQRTTRREHTCKCRVHIQIRHGAIKASLRPAIKHHMGQDRGKKF